MPWTSVRIRWRSFPPPAAASQRTAPPAPIRNAPATEPRSPRGLSGPPSSQPQFWPAGCGTPLHSLDDGPSDTKLPPRPLGTCGCFPCSFDATLRDALARGDARELRYLCNVLVLRFVMGVRLHADALIPSMPADAAGRRMCSLSATERKYGGQLSATGGIG